ncbi:hypothetical protein DV735_g2467, partial [Chaetothyriales sp. CBS 134920]
MGDPGATIPTLKTHLYEFGKRRSTEGVYADNLEVEALIVGAGFSGVFTLWSLRNAGIKTVIFEAGNDLGGTWRWNCYPGAMVDSEVPEYMLSIPETWKDHNWPSNYPSYRELRSYFDHVDKVLDIKKDTAFDSVVVDARFNEEESRWYVKTADGRTAKTRFLIPATGFAAKRYVPDWPGIEKFKGIVHHSSFWPDEEIDVSNKKCAIIGTGASGVQVTQAWGPVAGELKVFQRTPNLTLPMRRRDLTVEEQTISKARYPELFNLRERCFGGFLYGFSEKGSWDDSPEERQQHYERLWADGGFRFWLGNYKDYLSNIDTNRECHAFWAKKQQTRVQDARKRDILVPVEPPHPWGVKRPCLEHSYLEQFNRPNVDVVDIKNNEIKEFTETGIRLADGTHYEFDVICIATGFDVVNGGMTQMGLHNRDGVPLDEYWRKSTLTYLGLSVPGYPNMFHMYGAQAPTLLSNGPTTAEIQGRWITDVIKRMKREGIKSIEPTDEATREWKKKINALSDQYLFATVKSTYMGGNVPGRVFEQTNYAGGVGPYREEIRNVLPDWKGFKVVKE